MKILHLDDDPNDVLLVQRTLASQGVTAEVVTATTPAEFVCHLERGGLDLILADNGLPGFSGQAALDLAKERCPTVPFIFVSGTVREDQALADLKSGRADIVLKGHLWQLAAVVRRVKEARQQEEAKNRLERLNRSMHRLVKAAQELFLARDLEGVMAVVRRAARELTGADGATFVLRDGDQCHYADEDAISPLWKGQRFPMNACISGWAMLNKTSAVIEDIYTDPRIASDAYRSTFVKSLAMVPIRTEAPVGAIGNYWARRHRPSAEEVELLETLANTTAVAMENVGLYAELEQRVKDRTLQWEAANRELEAFSYSVSHDLRAPLRAIQGFTQALAEDYAGQLDAQAKDYVKRVCAGTQRMGALIEDLLRLSRFARGEMRKERVNLSQTAQEILRRLQAGAPERRVEFQIAEGLETQGDAGLLRVVLENFLTNAWKYTSKRSQAQIEFGAASQSDGSTSYYVRDNGAGFDMRYADKLFGPFQRLHREEDFPGSGIGLATVQRIVHRHGGRVWCEAVEDQGAIFYFTLPQSGAIGAASAPGSQPASRHTQEK